MNIKRRDCCQPLGTQVKNAVTARQSEPTMPKTVRGAATEAKSTAPGKIRNTV